MAWPYCEDDEDDDRFEHALWDEGDWFDEYGDGEDYFADDDDDWDGNL
jgi:hypothetical protein